MTILSNKPDMDELLNQVKAYLSSAELCASVFNDNPKYLPYCEAQKNSSTARVTSLIKTQVDTLNKTAKSFLPTSYSAERTNQARTKP